MSNPESLQLLYITSNGRSGSTLLEVLLNAFDAIMTTGEVYVFPWEVEEKRRTCGCGAPVDVCPFWGPVIRRLDENSEKYSEVGRFRDSYRVSGWLKPGEWINILFSRHVRSLNLLNRFTNQNRSLLKYAHEQAEILRGKPVRYLIDSSKNYYRLFWLINGKPCSIKIIHIVKDPRAFVYSWIRNCSGNALQRLWITFRMSIRYVFENFMIEHVVRNVKKKDYLFLRYEDLASQPEATLRSIATWLDVPYQASALSSFRTTENHGIAGNISRHESRGITLDRKWIAGLRTAEKGLTWVLCCGYAKKYGYYKDDTE